MELEYFRRFDAIMSKLKSTYARIRRSRLFSAYVVLTMVFCLLQVSTHLLVFLNDRAASSRFSSITAQAKVPRRFAYQLPNNTILICDDIRGNENCKVAGNTFDSEAMVSPIRTGISTSSAVMIAIISSTGISALSLPTPTATENTTSSTTMISTIPTTGSIGSSFPPLTTTETLPSPAATTPSTGLSGSSFPAPTGTSRRPHGPHGPHGPHNHGPHNRESVQPSFRFARRHAYASASGIRSVYAFTRDSILHNRRNLDIQPQINSSGNIDGVNLTGLNGQSQPVTLSIGCIESLAFPDTLFRDAKREDLTMISFSFWVLVMSVASIIYDSIPHLVVALLGNCASLGWSISQVTLTARFSKVIYNAITVKACGGIELRPAGVLKRNEQMIASAIINGCFFPVFMFLSYKIFRIYRHQSLQRVGATNKVYNIYTLALGFSVCLHLSGFLVISTSVLWLDEVLTGVIRKYFHSKALVIALFTWGIVGNIPWLFMGSNIIFRERKRMMLGFLVHSVAVSVLWATTITTRFFQYTIWTWPFFASLSILSFIFLVATAILGIVCRYNFGNGLKHYSSYSPAPLSSPPNASLPVTVLEVLEEAKFTPGVFSHDLEKADVAGSRLRARAAVLTERHTADSDLSGVPIRNSTFSAASSYAQSNDDLPSPWGNRARSTELTPTDHVGLPRRTGRVSGDSYGSGVTGLSWSSWLWSHGVTAMFRSRTPSPTSVAPSSYRAPRLSIGIQTGRSSSSSCITADTSSATLTSSNGSQFVTDLFYSNSTIGTDSGQPVISKPPPSHPR